MPLPARTHTVHALALSLAVSLGTMPAQDEQAPAPTDAEEASPDDSPEPETPAQPEPPTTGELIEQGRYDEAAVRLDRLRELWEQELAAQPSPKALLQLARVLIWLGTVEDSRARFESAIGHFDRAAKILAENEGAPEILGSAYDGLGRAYQRSGRYQEAEQALQLAIDTRQRSESPDRDRWVNASRTHLGLLHLTTGRYQEAGKLLHDVLDATPKALASQQALRNSHLGRYYHTIRSYAKARYYNETALEFAEAEWGRDHPNTITILDQLGLTLLRLGEVSLARAAMEEAAELAAARATNRDGSMRFATVLNNFGNLLIEEGDIDGARERFKAALEPLQKHLGGDHPALAPIWNNLAFTCQARGDHSEAMRFFTQVRDNYLRHVGPHHQRTVEAMTNLAITSLLAQDPDAAEHAAAAAMAQERVFLRLVSFGSERQRLNFLQRVDPLSLPCTSGHDPALIANTLLRTKGRLLDVLLAEQSTGTDARLENAWRLAQQRLDQLLLSGTHPDGVDSSRLRAEIASLESQVEAARPVAADAAEPTWPQLQARLLPRSAFVDFVRYTHFAPDGGGRVAYGAIVILPAGEPSWIPLGSEDTLQSWIGVMRDRLDYRAGLLTGAEPRDPPALRLNPALRKLYDEFFAPVAEVIPGDTTLLCLCPDGALNFLSFAVLLDERGRFLADRHDAGLYVSSGRDLLAGGSSPELDGKPWSVFAVSDFAPAPAKPPDPPSRFHEQLAAFLSGFAPIAGADREVRVIEKFLPDGSQVFAGTAATERELAALQDSPAVLHLVTHGFFLPGDPDPLPRLADFDESPTRLYRSGIVLHGAKKGVPGGDPGNDDILFATDVVGLPLEETRLVTLSSCESALGESLAGEGVLGLRRGFALAGARNLLLTLWPVSDASTPAFMERFYQLALATDHLGQAVWQTQRETLQDVDVDDDDALEEAVLRSGPFVLCQREPLAPPAAAIPPPAGAHAKLVWMVVAGSALVLWIVVLMFGRSVRR